MRITYKGRDRWSDTGFSRRHTSHLTVWGDDGLNSARRVIYAIGLATLLVGVAAVTL
jgi:hypothetical protein